VALVTVEDEKRGGDLSARCVSALVSDLADGHGWGRMYYPGCRKPPTPAQAEIARLWYGARQEYSNPAALIPLALAFVAVAIGDCGDSREDRSYPLTKYGVRAILLRVVDERQKRKNLKGGSK